MKVNKKKPNEIPIQNKQPNRKISLPNFCPQPKLLIYMKLKAQKKKKKKKQKSLEIRKENAE